MTTRAQGFTLVELLVALVILVLLSVAAYGGLDSIIQTRDRLSQETRHWQQVSMFFARVEQDLAQTIPRPVRDQGGLQIPEFIGRAVTTTEEESSLEFTRNGVADQTRMQMPPQRMGYRLRNGTVELVRWKFPDQAPHTEPVSYPLLKQVHTLNFRYLDSKGNWQTNWPPPGQVGGRPTAVEVALTLKDRQPVTRIFALQ